MMGSKAFPFDDIRKGKRHAPATLRNREVIAEILAEILPASGTVLEIASGTGEHIVHFAERFPTISWQPSDIDEDALQSIRDWSAGSNAVNIAEPMIVRTEESQWAVDTAGAILCINMIHIAPWDACIGLFRGAAKLLSAGAPLYLYGPFLEENVETAQSNLSFDQSLRGRNLEWGIRHLNEVRELAEGCGFTLERRTAMPANNLSVVFRYG
ncbi:MAG: DUF938 domain-containing protein [Sphingorhabdus sp.]